MWRQRLLVATVASALWIPLSYSSSARGVDTATPSTAQKVDLNTATLAQLQELPGVGEVTAKKIIAGRPYSSVDELARAGVPKATADKIKGLVTVKPASKATGSESPAKPRAKVNLNTASLDELQQLPGVGEATARKIVAGRPYKSVDDLAKAGIPKPTIDKIRTEATVETTAQQAPSQHKINLNTATTNELQQLSGIGEVTARKIVASRPYDSVDDLAKAGVPKSTIDKIRTEVTVTRSATQKPAKQPVTGARESRKAPGQAVEARTPPHPGMVWVNTESGVFHTENSRWYGKTKEGKFMTPADATKAGYREAKND